MRVPDDTLPEQYLSPPTETAATVNLVIAAGAYEHIYMHPDREHVKEVQLPEPGSESVVPRLLSALGADHKSGALAWPTRRISHKRF